VVTPHVGEAHTTPLKQPTLFNQTGTPVATQGRVLGLNPDIFRKRMTIGLSNSIANTVLQTKEIISKWLNGDVGHKREDP
jgi:hypothetical protein